ncbi:hypothetical protein Q8A73_007159 [Channa argus]|nr:hypothetical protein Q8A73_007159 [Channa argus]
MKAAGRQVTSTAEKLNGDMKRRPSYPGELRAKHANMSTKIWVKVAMAIAYFFCVSVAAFILVIYYVFFWTPDPSSNSTSTGGPNRTNAGGEGMIVSASFTQTSSPEGTFSAHRLTPWSNKSKKSRTQRSDANGPKPKAELPAPPVTVASGRRKSNPSISFNLHVSRREYFIPGPFELLVEHHSDPQNPLDPRPQDNTPAKVSSTVEITATLQKLNKLVEKLSKISGAGCAEPLTSPLELGRTLL